MKKNLSLWLFSITIGLSALHSCSSEDDYFKSQDEKYTSNQFLVFSAQDSQTINYANGFKTLMERYDSLYSVSHTAKTMKRSLGKSEAVSTEYIEFNIRSQEFTTHEGEKYVLFPLIRNYQVGGIMVAALRENKTIVEYYEMASSEKNYREIFDLFKAEYVKSTINNNRLNKSGCGFDGLDPCDIPGVTITIPKPGNGTGLPPGGGGGTSGGCSIYQNCIDSNLDGGGGGAPDLGDERCLKAFSGVSKANKILQSSAGQQKMDAILKSKVQETNEFGVGIGQSADGGIEITAPKEGTPSSVASPTDQLTSPPVGTGHSHAGASGHPSAGDLYSLLERIVDFPNFRYSFIYGISNGTTEIYTLIITDPTLAAAFLAQYPRSENYDPVTHDIKFRSELGEDFQDMKYMYGYDSSGNTSGEYYDKSAVAMAHMLDKFNSGVSLAKADSSGNLKAINTSIQEITKVNGISDGKAIVSKCP
ncbi:hypothetical protein [Chryseobacterium sp.]|uniref:hypothetical protein n=1 Tax=Chryseobacterium sp. TaxID=1871047 RepID=UPI0025BBC254|nr:hypothetical protein [Chryseobacterium sp.]